MADRGKTTVIPQPFDPANTDTDLWLFLAPHTIDWQSTISEFLILPSRGRTWRASTGSIIGAQEIGRQIYESIMIINATDLINAVREVAKAIAGGDVDYDQPFPRQVTYDGTDWATLLGALELTQDIQVDVPELPVTVNNNVPVPSVTAKNYIDVTCSSCGGGCGGGDAPTTPGSQGGSPPPGYSEPTFEGEPAPPGTGAYDARKCAVANLLHDSIIDTVVKLNDMPYVGTTVEILASTLGAAWLAAVSTLVSVYLGTTGLVGAIGLGVSGFLNNLATGLVNQFVDLEVLATELTDNREDLICAWYNSYSTAQAVSQYLQAASDAGIGIGNQTVLSALVIGDIVNILFFDKDAVSAKIEQALDGYTPPTDCVDCGGDILFPFASDLEGWELCDPAPEVNYPTGTNPYQGHSLTWVSDPLDSFISSTTSPIPGGLSIRSPIFSKQVNATTKWYSNWRITNATVDIFLEFSDGTFANIYGVGVTYGEPNQVISLNTHAGKTINRIHWWAAASAFSPRTLEIDYVDIKD